MLARVLARNARVLARNARKHFSQKRPHLFFANTQLRKVDGEKLITELVRSKNMPLLFGDDGVFINTPLENDGLPPEVRRILALEEKAIPLLVAHLDDTRLMPMTSCCSQPPEITVGDACLNILPVITGRVSPIFDKQCIKTS